MNITKHNAKINPPKKLLIAAVAAAALGGGLVACESDPRTVGSDPQIDVAASHHKVLVGETVTLTVSSRNLVARDADIEWYTSGGDLQEINDGRSAQITFDRPGTYDVGADLIVNGARQQIASERITVSPIPR